MVFELVLALKVIEANNQRMRPDEPLFISFENKIEEHTPSLFAYEEMRRVTANILIHARENCRSVALPRLGHFRTALQRSLSPDGLTIPSGKTYLTSSYEDFTLGEPAIEYENRLVVLTNDKDKTKGRIANALDRVLDEKPQHKGVFVVLGLVSPKETSKVTSVDGIMFAVVQSNSGEAFAFTFAENSNFGKVRATEAMSNEFGDVRERFGNIDTCSVEARRMSSEEMALVKDELEKARVRFEEVKNGKKEGSNLEARAQSIGKSVVEKAKLIKSKVLSTVPD